MDDKKSGQRWTNQKEAIANHGSSRPKARAKKQRSCRNDGRLASQGEGGDAKSRKSLTEQFDGQSAGLLLCETPVTK